MGVIYSPTSTPNPYPQGGGERFGEQRRGACPGLSTPMPTGDGLLARLLPIGTIPLAAFAELMAASRAYGHGIVEVTSRGSIQARGLSPRSAPHFAATVGELGIAAADGVPVLTNPLAGLDAQELFDAAGFAANLREALALAGLAEKLDAKISIAIDGGGQLDLDALAADIRLRAEMRDGATVLRIGLGGDAAGAVQLGTVAPAHGQEAALRLLGVLALKGRAARARDNVASEGSDVFRAALRDLLDPAAPGERGSELTEARRLRKNPIGEYVLKDGFFARGIGLAFGHADASALEQLVEEAAAAGATGVRTAPGRALLVLGLDQQNLSHFAGRAERLGFVVDPADPRRFVVACAGAPVCPSAQFATRTIAPDIATAVARFLSDTCAVHLSGCAKGCAHAAAAALTVIGTADGCALVADGTVRDKPFAAVEPNQLPSTIAHLLGARGRGAVHA